MEEPTGENNEAVIAELMPELSSLAMSLYGTDADLSFVTRVAGREAYEPDMRSLLRSEFGLVQDPVSGMWVQLLDGAVRVDHEAPLEK